MTVKLSVCITTHNRSKGLDRTLESLANQTRLPDEIVVSDDASKDETQRVVERWKERLPQIRYVRSDTNLRMPGNLNVAVSACSGDFIANLHDADQIAPTLLEKWERALTEYPSAGFVFCGIKGWPQSTERGDGIILHQVKPLTPGKTFYEQHMKHRFSSIVWGTVMARRTAYNLLLPFDATFGFTSDVDMWMRMCLLYDVAYVREPLITLDHSPTNERGNGVNWQWVQTARAIQLANLKRFYGADPVRLHREHRVNRRKYAIYLLRRIAGRVWHHDPQGVIKGLSLLVGAIKLPHDSKNASDD